MPWLDPVSLSFTVCDPPVQTNTVSPGAVSAVNEPRRPGRYRSLYGSFYSSRTKRLWKLGQPGQNSEPELMEESCRREGQPETREQRLTTPVEEACRLSLQQGAFWVADAFQRCLPGYIHQCVCWFVICLFGLQICRPSSRSFLEHQTERARDCFSIQLYLEVDAQATQYLCR